MSNIFFFLHLSRDFFDWTLDTLNDTWQSLGSVLFSVILFQQTIKLIRLALQSSSQQQQRSPLSSFNFQILLFFSWPHWIFPEYTYLRGDENVERSHMQIWGLTSSVAPFLQGFSPSLWDFLPAPNSVLWHLRPVQVWFPNTSIYGQIQEFQAKSLRCISITHAVHLSRVDFPSSACQLLIAFSMPSYILNWFHNYYLWRGYSDQVNILQPESRSCHHTFFFYQQYNVHPVCAAKNYQH